jgi:radical SAM protein with 4Fe4S-binding SPASM domain
MTRDHPPLNRILDNNRGYDRLAHYTRPVGPVHEFGDLPETPPTILNIGWTLGNDCPYRCAHCYSMNARERGRDMNKPMIDRIVGQLIQIGVATVNLGGNEPIFTNGIKLDDSLLHYIIDALHDADIQVGLTTSGISILKLYERHKATFLKLNDVDVSFDSPYEEEHNKNRGAKIFHQAVAALDLCRAHSIPHTCIMAAMSWNFSRRHIDALFDLALAHDANIRINPVKPIEPHHMAIALPVADYYAGFSRLLELCTPIDLGEPPIAAMTQYSGARRCPCGRTSFRIHSITPKGEIFVSPCVYLHDYKAPLDLLKFDLIDIINSPQFRTFRQRNANPDKVGNCAGCDYISRCGGGCAARSYLYHSHLSGGERTMRAKDPYCPRDAAPTVPFPVDPAIDDSECLVHMDYLCTWIGRPNTPGI